MKTFWKSILSLSIIVMILLIAMGILDFSIVSRKTMGSLFLFDIGILVASYLGYKNSK